MTERGQRHPELAGTYPHHPDCPGCAHERNVDHAIRAVNGLRRARVRDRVIRAHLIGDRWFTETVVDDALEWADAPAIE